MTAVTCEQPAFRLRDVNLTVDPRLDAVEEILQLRHDIDDHALAVKLLRGIRPDLDDRMVADWIDNQLDAAGDVRAAELDRGDVGWAIDIYELRLREFVYGGPR
jgi:hypothetical protein